MELILISRGSERSKLISLIKDKMFEIIIGGSGSGKSTLFVN